MPDWLAEYAALSAADREQSLPAEDLERLAQAAFLLGRDAEVDSLRERAHEQYLERGLVDEAVQCGFWLGFHLQNRGELARSAGWAARLRRIVPDDPESRFGGLLMMRDAVALMWSGDVSAALPIFERGVRIAETWSDLDAFVLGQMGRGRCLQVLGRTAEGADAMDEAMVHVAAGSVAPQVVGLAYCSVIDLCMARFDLRRAHEWTQALTGWVDEQQGMVPYRGLCLVHRAEILQLRGAWVEAEREADEACVRLMESGESALGGAHYRVGELARLRGRFDAAASAYERAAACGTEVQPGLARLRLAQRRPDAAVAGLDRVLAENPDPATRPALLSARIEIALAIGDLPAANAALVELTGLVEPAAPDYLLAMLEHAGGAVELACGRPRTALPRLRRAWSLWQEVEAPYDAARTRLLAAQTCRELGDLDAARMELDAARTVLEQLGAVVDLADLDPADAGPLTPREREVLQLLATGATNRAIAEHFILSEKTVARHVSNIFGKLDVTSRAAATAYAYEHGLT